MKDYETINEKEKLLEQIFELKRRIYQNSKKHHFMLSADEKKLYEKVADDIMELELLRDFLSEDYGMDREEIKRAEAKVWIRN